MDESVPAPPARFPVTRAQFPGAQGRRCSMWRSAASPLRPAFMHGEGRTIRRRSRSGCVTRSAWAPAGRIVLTKGEATLALREQQFDVKREELASSLKVELEQARALAGR